MEEYALLNPVDEDALHASRLLNFEEKHFKRLTKRLLAVQAEVTSLGEGDGSAAGEEVTDQMQPAVHKLKQTILLDFAAFDSNIVRAQLLLNSNGRERARYAEEKLRIQDTAQTVKENNTLLHSQLRDAKATLEARKAYDTLAEKITNNKALKTREEQDVQLETLRLEIAELKNESELYARTWAERREQFGRIVEEGTQLLRLIRDEKEEAERKEGMDDMSGDERESTPTRGVRSVAATPGGGSTPLHSSISLDPPKSPQRSKLRDAENSQDQYQEASGAIGDNESREETIQVADSQIMDETMEGITENDDELASRREQPDIEMGDT